MSPFTPEMQDEANDEGWCLSERSDNRYEIQRCDEQDIFDTDEQALTFVRIMAGLGHPIHTLALALDGTPVQP